MMQEPSDILLQQKIAFVNMLANVTMLWWVSSVVFCATILASVWYKRDLIRSPRQLRWLLFVFFLSIVAYGVLVVAFLWGVEPEVSSLAAGLGADDDYFSTELGFFRAAVLVGTSSFVLVLLAWIFIWRNLSSIIGDSATPH